MIDEKNLNNEAMEDEDLIDLVDENGRHLKFYHVGSTERKGKWYAFFMPAEQIEGLSDEEVVIFEVDQGENGEEILLPIDDDLLLEEVYEQFCTEMEEEADAADAYEMEGCSCGCGHHHGEECDGDCECEGDCDCDGCDDKGEN